MASAQAKLTWPGSDLTSGFWQAIPACRSTVATLAGHEAPPVTSTVTPTVASTAAMAMPATAMRVRVNRK